MDKKQVSPNRDTFMIADTDTAPKTVSGLTLTVLSLFVILGAPVCAVLLKLFTDTNDGPAGIALFFIWPIIAMAYLLIPTVAVCFILSMVFGVKYLSQTRGNKKILAALVVAVTALAFVLSLWLYFS